MRALRLFIAGGAFLFVAANAPAQEETPSQPPKKTYETGQKVMVREGDSWSAVTIVKREGRKYQVRYDDGTEEWVGAGRLRAGDGKPGDDDSPFKKSTKKTPARPAGGGKYKVGDKVELHSGLSWYPASIKQMRGDQYFVHYDGWSDTWDEWVGPERLRRPGQVTDDGDTAGSRDPFRQNEPDDPERPVTEPDARDAAELQFLATPGAKFTPDPAADKKLSPRNIPLSGGAGGHWPYVSSIEFGKSAALAVFAERTGRDKSARVERIDLALGRSTNVWPLAPEMKLAALGADGKRAVIQSDRFFSNTRARLDVYSLMQGKPEYVLGFLPYKQIDPKWKDVSWTRFIGNKHLLTVGGWAPDAHLVLWELPDCKAKWKAAVPYHSVPALSPGGKQVALSLKQAVVVLNALTGETLAMFPTEYGGGALGFSPDGERLAMAVGGTLVLFDLVKGEMLAAIAASGWQTTPQWTDPDHVLAGDVLYSVAKKCPLWTYKRGTAQQPATVVGGITWFVTDDRSPRLAGLPVPGDDALKAEQSIDEQTHLLLGPGGKVSLEVNVGGEAAKVAEALTRQLAAVGIGVAAGQSVRLRATVTRGQNREMTYEVAKFGQPFNKEIVKKSVTETVYAVAIVGADNKPAWQISSTSGAPSFFHAAPGESIDTALQRYSKPSADWFLSVKVPTHVPKPQFATGLGASQLTAQGIGPARGG